MRNSGFLKEIDEESMRNTCSKNVSHNVILWLRVLYLESMRMWEIKLKNLGSSSNLVVISFLFQLSSSFLILLKVVDMFAF